MKWQLLHQACWAGDAEEVERLLAAGADANRQAPTNWRQTPLGRTLEFRITHPKHAGHVEVVRALLRQGADPAARSTSLDMTPYELACFCGLAPAADLLREFQSRAAPHPSGMTELWLASAARLPEHEVLAEVRRLLSKQAVNSVWRKATPLLMAAAHAAHFRVADLLFEGGADPNLGPSILDASCSWHFQYFVPAMEYLVRKGWNVNARDSQGQTALHKAAFLGSVTAARTLLAHGADPAAQDSAGATPMDFARRWRKPAALKVLSQAS